MREVCGARDAGDGTVSERGEVADGVPHAGRVVRPDARQSAGHGRVADDERGHGAVREHLDARILVDDVDQEHRVDFARRPPFLQGQEFCSATGDDLQQKAVRPFGEFFLETGEEAHIERLHTQGARIPGEHHADGLGARIGEGSCRARRRPAHLRRDREHALASRVRHPSPSVERERDGTDRQPGALGDVADGHAHVTPSSRANPSTIAAPYASSDSSRFTRRSSRSTLSTRVA